MASSQTFEARHKALDVAMELVHERRQGPPYGSASAEELLADAERIEAYLLRADLRPGRVEPDVVVVK